MWRTHISHSVADPHGKENSVIHCVADPQVKEMRLTNSSERYGCQLRWLTGSIASSRFQVALKTTIVQHLVESFKSTPTIHSANFR